MHGWIWQVFLNFCVQRGLKESGAEAGRVWVPKELPDPLQIPASILQNNRFGTCFLKAFIYTVFSSKRTCKHNLKKYSQNMEKQDQWTWRSTNRRESRRCSQAPGRTDSGGDAVRRGWESSVLRDSPGPGDHRALLLRLSGNLMVQVCLHILKITNLKR